jgi:leucyl aminopeptidase
LHDFWEWVLPCSKLGYFEAKRMKFSAIETTPFNWSGDALAIGLFEGGIEVKGDLAKLDEQLAGTIKELLDETEFKGKVSCSAVARVGRGSSIRKVILIGLGKPETASLENWRVAAATAAKLSDRQYCRTLGLSVPLWNEDAEATVGAIVEGIELGLHQDTRFKSETKERSLAEIHLLGLAGQEAAITRSQQLCSGVILARELVSAPANTVTPLTMAETAQSLAAEYGLALEILEQEDCEQLGMGAFLGVAQASDLPPKFIHLTYNPSTTPRKKVAIVGKGLTFDSGGLNIKVSGSGIEMMKTDMGGAAATLGAAKAIAQLQPDVEVHFISAVTENMISGHAMHPGDILRASNGKTIEVNNTDAEGRLTLADALVFADKLGLDAIVDLATLTGACVIALGDRIGGLWSNNEALAQQLLQAAAASGEKLWQMPMEERYLEGLKSPIADFKNTGPRPGAAITAALFLKEFVKDTAWAHLDVAGPVWADKESGYNNQGATGYGVRTLVNWVFH